MNYGWKTRLAALLCLCLLVAALASPMAAADGTAQDITKKCTFKVSEGKKGKLTDGSVRTTWSYTGSDAWVGVKLPDNATAGWLRIEWLFDPTGFELMEYDAERALLRQRSQADTFPNIYTVFELLPETKYIQLLMTASDQEICLVKVYSQGELPASVQVWNPPVEKADLMLVSTHQDDEVVFMGGTIPYYATALKKPTIVVYMTNCTRYRRNEALNCLWRMGVKDYPEFINLKDKRVDSIDEGIELWGGKDNILSLLVERIRRYKPEVIVTHDLDGEYGHNQHKITARAMKYAIDAAADPAQYPGSAQRYGVWQVKKLYLHLYKENELMMDWETPLESLNGYSPLKVAQIGMNEQASQLKYYQVKSHGKYDNAKFGLYFTTVGQDVAKNDFLENIDPDASSKYLTEHADEIARRAAQAAAAEAPTPAPTEAPTPEPTEEPIADEPAEPTVDEPAEPAVDEAAEPAAEPEAEAAATEPPAAATPGPAAEPAMTDERGGVNAGVAAALVAAGIAVAGGGWYAWRRYRGTRHKRRRRRY